MYVNSYYPRWLVHSVEQSACLCHQSTMLRNRPCPDVMSGFPFFLVRKRLSRGTTFVERLEPCFCLCVAASSPASSVWTTLGSSWHQRSLPLPPSFSLGSVVVCKGEAVEEGEDEARCPGSWFLSPLPSRKKEEEADPGFRKVNDRREG